jgi:predicted Zn-dependent peptidase
MKKYIFVGLCLFASVLGAQQKINSYADYPSENWVMRKFQNDPLNVRYYTFKNGLTLITSTNKKSPRINTMVAVKTGSKNDPSTNTGLAHYLEHMLFKGTDQYGSYDWSKEKPLLDQIDALYEQYNSTKDEALRTAIYHKIDSTSQLAAKFAIANEFDKMCQAMGAEGTNAFTSNDMTVYVNDVPSNMMDKWLTLESERYRNPVLRLFHTELEAVYEEKNIGMDRDGDKVWEALYAELFKKHNYGLQTTIGTIEHLKNPSLKAIRNYYNTYYVPNNMAIIMAGDFNPDEAAKMVAEKFSYMKKTEVPVYKFEEETPRNTERTIELVGPDADNLTIGFRTPGAKSKEATIIKLIDLLLNNSSAGLIDLNLVKKQLVLAANSGTDIMKDYSMFILTGKPKEGQKLEELKDLLLAQLEKIRKGEFDEKMLKSILLNEEISKIESFKENESRTSFLISTFVNDLDYRAAASELALMAEISKAEIVAFANEYLGNDRVVVYKRKGEVQKANKIVKPEIHPVELNRDKQSKFVKDWLEMPSLQITPAFFDAKNITVSKSGIAPVYYVKNADNRLFNLTLKFNQGSWHDKRTSLLFSYLKFLGTKEMSSEDFSKKMYDLGCKYSVSNDEEHAYINLNGPDENFNEALKMVQNVLRNPMPNEKALQSLIGDILKSRENNKFNARIIQRQLSQYVMYGPNNPSTWIIKNSDLKNITSVELLKLLKDVLMGSYEISYYGPRALEGKLKDEKIENSVLSNLGESGFMPKGFKPGKKDIPVFTERKMTEKEVYFTHYPQVQATINWWTNAGDYTFALHPTVVAFNQYFGGDMSSVVFQNIREAKALAYSTYALFNEPKKPTKPYMMSAFVGTQADKFHDAIASMNELLTVMPADEEVFGLAKQSIVNRIETERVMPENYVGMMWAMQEKGLTEDPNKSVYQEIGNIKISDISNFHKNHIANKIYHLAIVASRDKISKEDMGRYGKVNELTLEELFGY